MASSGNFATWNPLTIGSRASLADGNLTMKGTSVDLVGVTSTIGITSGKWYWEIYIARGYDTYMYAGINSGYEGGGFYSGYAHLNGMTPGAIRIRNNGTLSDSSSSDDPDRWGTITLNSTNVQTFDDGDILMFALDYDNKKLWIGKNGTFMNSGNPAGGSNQQASWDGDVPIIYPCAEPYYTNNNETANFGQDSSFSNNKTSGSANASDSNGFGDFYYTPPTDYLALTTANVPISNDIDPAQTDDNIPTKQFNTILYTGIGGTSANNVSGVGFSPDLIWIKNREQSANFSNCLVDSSRGRAGVLYSQRTDSEATSAVNRDISSINSDGFTIQDTSNIDGNQSGIGYVAWCWKCNSGTTTSDGSGDITVTRQTNDVAKFSILTYTGSGSSGNTIAHGLGVKPAMTIIKQRNSSNGWNVWHQGNNNGDYDSFGELNSNSAWYQNQGSNGPYTADPTSSLLTLSAYGQVNGSGNTYVAYVWADVEGMQKFGSYTASGNEDGPFIYLGFRPRLIFIKNADTGGRRWTVLDSARNTSNLVDSVINWDDAQAEYDSSARGVDFLSNGFKIKGNDTDTNQSGNTMLYGAWGDVPFKYGNTFG